MDKLRSLLCVLTLASTILAAHTTQNVSFSIANFSDTRDLLLMGETMVTPDGTLYMTFDNSTGATGPYFISRVLHNSPVLMHDLSQGLAASFSSSFTFTVASNQTETMGHGLTLAIVPNDAFPHTRSASAPALGLFDVDFYKPSNASLLHLVAIEYDTCLNLEYRDPDDHHVGLDINALTSTVAESLPPDLVLRTTNFSRRLTTWIDYDATTHNLDVYLAVAPAQKASATKVLHYSELRIWDYVNSTSYVGFTAATGIFQEMNAVYDWNFSSWLVFIPVVSPPITSLALASSSPKMRTVLITAGTLVAFVVVLSVILVFGWKRHVSKGLRLDVDLMTAPRKFTYRELRMATGDFNEVLGHGGSGDVYKGVIMTRNREVEHVAVKRILRPASKHGERQFKSEILTIGKLRHRNLVHLYGWCTEKEQLLLVYQLMPHGSLEKLLYSKADMALNWPLRFQILKGVAAALVYLHMDGEKLIIHRDIKASNVLLDSDLNARLGDFGLARCFDHEQYCTQASATGIAGTLGYMAPEYAMSGRVTRESDIYSFGILALEIACGCRPFLDTDESLLDYVWRKHEEGNLMHVADARMQREFDVDEMRCVLHIGLLCAHPDPKSRLSTRQVLQTLREEAEVPQLPPCRPVAIYVQVETPKVYRDGILASKPFPSLISASSSINNTIAIDLSGPR